MKISQYLLDEGYVVKKKHPTEELYLYNYTPKAQFEGINSPVWKDYPEMQWCRGLILNDKDEVIARPFPKFWNIESYENDGLPPYNSFEIYDKMDGSLGIVYCTSKGVAVATRGSFESEQAIWATKFLNERYADLVSDILKIKNYHGEYNHTWLFELIYPENRIVVDYKGDSKMVLLSIMNNNSGMDLDWINTKLLSIFYKIPLVDKFDGITDFKDIRNIIKRDNAEGFVIKFDTGLRVKIKYEEYVKLHSLMTDISTTSIWECVKDGIDIEQMFKDVPDEMFQLIIKEKNKIQNDFYLIERYCQKMWDYFPNEIDPKDRKSIALYITRTEGIKQYSSIMFSMLDKKPYSEIIWKMVKPEYRKVVMYSGKETE